MGVPYFFKKLLDKERKYKQQILFDKLNKQPNVLYIDGNCAIHPECFKIADKMIDEPDTYIKEGYMIKQIIDFFDYLEDFDHELQQYHQRRLSCQTIIKVFLMMFLGQ